MCYKLFAVLWAFTVIFLSIPNSLAAEGDADPFFMTGAGFDNDVLGMAFDQNGRIIVGGEFTSIVGVPFNRIARMDATGNIDFTFNPGGSGANNFVYAVKSLPDGKILIGGTFTSYNGTPINGLARLNPDGTLDTTFNAGMNTGAAVYNIILQPDNQILIGGGFSSVNGVSRRMVARLSYDGILDQSFTFTPILEFNGGVLALALQTDGKVLIGGNFWNTDTGMNNNIARLNVNGSLDTGFTARTNWVFEPPVTAIAVRPDGKVLIGGQFSLVNNVQKFSLALLNSNGTLDNSFTASGISRVLKIDLQPDGKIVLAGDFSGSGFDIGLKRLNSNGTDDASFVSIEEDSVKTFLLAADGKIVAGGLMPNRFANPFFGANPSGVRKLNSDGSRDSAFFTKTGAVFADPVREVVEQTSGKIILWLGATSGISVGGYTRTTLARLNADGTVEENYSPDLRGTAMGSLPDNSVVVGGIPNPDTGSTGRCTFRKINPDGSVDPNFAVDSVGPTKFTYLNVMDIEVQPDGKIIALGNFHTVAGSQRRSLVRLNPDGSIDASFTPNIIASDALGRRAVLQPDGKIWVSISVPGSGHAVYRLNANGIAETFTQVNGAVHAISPLNDGKAYVGGDFTSIGGYPHAGVARLNQDGTVDTSFVPPTFTNSASSYYIHALFAQPNGKVLVGGEFSTVGGIQRRSFARLNTNGSLDASFNASLSGGLTTIYSLRKQIDGKLLVGGSFDGIGGLPKSRAARLKAFAKPAVFDFDGDSKTDLSIFRPSVGEWWWLKSSNGGNAAAQFGAGTDKLTPGDFTGDGKTDIAFWRPSNGFWFVLRSENFSFYSFPFGTSGDIPAVGDFDADGKADATIFRPSNGTWYISKSSGGTLIQQFGQNGDVPVVADYDGDGKSDIAIYRTALGEWWIQRSAAGLIAFQFGNSADKPVPGDFTGDGKADVALFRPSSGEWFVLRSENQSYYSFPFGTSGDVPAPGDYDGDGKFDATVFRPSTSTWYAQRSTAGTLIQSFGQTGDAPVPNAFVP